MIYFLRARCEEAQERIKAERERIEAEADEDGYLAVEIDGDEDDEAMIRAVNRRGSSSSGGWERRASHSSHSSRPNSPLSRPRPYLLAAARASAKVRKTQQAIGMTTLDAEKKAEDVAEKPPQIAKTNGVGASGN